MNFDITFIEGIPYTEFHPIEIERNSCEGEIEVSSNYESINLNKSGIIILISYPTSNGKKPLPHKIPSEISHFNYHVEYDGSPIYETIKEIPLVFYLRSSCNGQSILNSKIEGISVTIVDAIGKPLKAEIIPTHISEPNKNNGRLAVVTRGGSGDLTYKWSGPNNYFKDGKNLNEISGLSPGLYQLTITDLQSSDIITLEQYIYNPLIPNVIVTNTSGKSKKDGKINLTPQGGSGFYRFEWLGPNGFYLAPKNTNDAIIEELNSSDFNFELEIGSFQNYIFRDGPEDLENLSPGVYQLTMLDVVTGVRIYRSYEINEPRLKISLTKKDVSEFGGNDGEIFVDVLEGSGFYQFDWTGPNEYINGPTMNTFDHIKDLIAGIYCLRVFDPTLNEYAFEKIEVKEPSLTLIKFNIKNPTNIDKLDGEIEANVIGGYGPFTWDWFGVSGAENNILTNIGVGRYSVTATDTFNGEIISGTIDITLVNQCTKMEITLNVKDNTCSNTKSPNGSIDAVITGGSGDYQFTWKGVSINRINSNSAVITNLKSGKYELTVFDKQTKKIAKSFATIKAVPFEVNLIGTNPSTKKGRDGRIDAIVRGCSGKYIYNWFGLEPNCSVNPQDATIINLRAGRYSVRVEDIITGHVASASIELSDDVQDMITKFDITNVYRNDGRNGGVDLTINGGSGAFNYLWSNENGLSSTHEDLYNIEKGSYEIQITDSQTGKIQKNKINIIDQGEGLELQGELLVDHISKFGIKDGKIIVKAVGGKPPYHYIWTRNGQLIFDLDGNGIANNLEAGRYKIFVSDSCDNIIELETSLASPPPNKLQVCIGGRMPTTSSSNDGLVFTQINGGYPNYTYTWWKDGKEFTDNEDGGKFDGLLSNAGYGEYLVQVSDNICQREGALLILPDPGNDPCEGKRKFRILSGSNLTFNNSKTSSVLGPTKTEDEIILLIERSECCLCCEDPIIVGWEWEKGFTGGIYIDNQMLMNGEVKYAKCGASNEIQTIRLKVKYKPNEIGLVQTWPSNQLSYNLKLKLRATCDSQGVKPTEWTDEINVLITVTADPNFDPSNRFKFKGCPNC